MTKETYFMTKETYHVTKETKFASRKRPVSTQWIVSSVTIESVLLPQNVFYRVCATWREVPATTRLILNIQAGRLFPTNGLPQRA